MDLLGDYNSDGDDSEVESQAIDDATVAKSFSSESNATRRRVDFSCLPVAKRVHTPISESDSPHEHVLEAPLRKAAEFEAKKVDGRGILACLPPPKLNPSFRSEVSSGGIRLDVSVDRTEQRAHIKGSTPNLMPEMTLELPDTALSHRMFCANDETGGDAPTAEELDQMKRAKFFHVKAEELRDPNWEMSNLIAGGPGLHKGKAVAEEMSMYERPKWNQTTHKDPSRIQKRKHQINWLAHEAMENEAEMLDRAASSRQTKSQTSMKYGW